MQTSATPADTATPAPRKKGAPKPIPMNAMAGTLHDAALTSGLSVATLRRHEKAGRLRFFKVGGRTLVDATSLRALLTGNVA